jgi:multiple antibiotic resistance protein
MLMHWLKLLLFAWIPLFVAIDPVGLIPLFLGMTDGIDPARRRRISHQALVTAAVVLVGFMFLGKLTFRVLGITVGDFKIAGGLILFILASRDLMRATGRPQVLPDDFGIVPLGLPLIAGPATLTTLLILMDSVGVGYSLAALLLNLLVVALAFHFAEGLARLIGQTGLRAISKIIALLLAAIAVSMIRRGWQSM